MGLRLQTERLRVHLPAALARAGCDDFLSATCTQLSSIEAHLDADEVPAPGDRLELVLTLPHQRTLKLFGTVNWSITTSAPALLCCGKIDRCLGGRFTLDFAPSSPDLFALSESLRAMQQSRQRRRTHVRRVARRLGFPSARFA
jgi:hypothetical protein